MLLAAATSRKNSEVEAADQNKAVVAVKLPLQLKHAWAPYVCAVECIPGRGSNSRLSGLRPFQKRRSGSGQTPSGTTHRRGGLCGRSGTALDRVSDEIAAATKGKGGKPAMTPSDKRVMQCGSCHALQSHPVPHMPPLHVASPGQSRPRLAPPPPGVTPGRISMPLQPHGNLQ